MTEGEWLACSDPKPMLEYLRGKANDRKLRLFAVACAESSPSFSQFSLEAIETVKKHVDLQTTTEERRKIADAWDYRGHEESGWYHLSLPDTFGVDAAAEVARDTAAHSGARTTTYNAFSAARDAMRKVQCCLLHDIFGPLQFRPVTIEPSWFSWNYGTIPKIAKVIYEESHFQDLPILADALEEGGCTNADILNHCRAPGPHVRGCWVVDILMGKE